LEPANNSMQAAAAAGGSPDLEPDDGRTAAANGGGGPAGSQPWSSLDLQRFNRYIDAIAAHAAALDGFDGKPISEQALGEIARRTARSIQWVPPWRASGILAASGNGARVGAGSPPAVRSGPVDQVSQILQPGTPWESANDVDTTGGSESCVGAHLAPDAFDGAGAPMTGSPVGEGISEGGDRGGATVGGKGAGAVTSTNGEPDVRPTSLAPYDSRPGYHWDENGNLVAPTDTTSIEQGIADFGHDLLGPGIQGPNPNLGALSAHEESRGDPGTVSTGVGDHGGVSYGTYQFATKEHSPAHFIASSAAARWRNDFAGLVPGTPAFSNMWKLVARKNPNEFAQAQHDYTKQTHYDPVVEDLKKATGIDFSLRSYALQDAIWSTAVHHGPEQASEFILKALAAVKAKGFNPYQKIADRLIIEQIYAERGRTNSAGVLVHFHSSSASFQKNIAARFVREKAAAIKMLYGG
jgi:hypothetical protein